MRKFFTEFNTNFYPCLIIEQINKFNFAGASMRPSAGNDRIKVSDNLVWVNVIPPDGVPRRVAGYSGESLL